MPNKNINKPAVMIIGHDTISYSSNDTRNILMIGANDIRHILRTLSQRYKFENTPKIHVIKV